MFHVALKMGISSKKLFKCYYYEFLVSLWFLTNPLSPKRKTLFSGQDSQE